MLYFFSIIAGYYQPAGPLISPHLLPPPPSIEGDQTQQSQSTNGTGENVDPDVMITGNNFHYNKFVMCNYDFLYPYHKLSLEYHHLTYLFIIMCFIFFFLFAHTHLFINFLPIYLPIF